jgi:hypothetical protein
VIVFGRIAQDRTATVKSLQSSSNRTIGTLPNFARAAMATSCGRHARLQRESLPVRPVAGLAQGEEPGQPCDDPGAGGGVVTANRRFAPSRARHCRSTTCHQPHVPNAKAAWKSVSSQIWDNPTLSASSWIEGEPEKSFWSGMKTKGKRRLAIVSYRCTKCGFLENYATQPATGV